MIGLASSNYRRTAAVAVICALPLLGAVLPYGPIKPPSEGRAIFESDSEYGYIQVVEKGSEHDLVLNEGQAVG